MPYVTDSAFPETQNEYVCWIDIMGTKSKMEHSVNTCGIFMLKFHAAILEAIQKKKCAINVYPVMDGVYITSKSVNDLQTAMFHIFSELGNLFLSENDFHHQFLVKASIAYGPVIHGKDIDNSVNANLAADESYKNSLLIGLPMIQALRENKKHLLLVCLSMSLPEHFTLMEKTLFFSNGGSGFYMIRLHGTKTRQKD